MIYLGNQFPADFRNSLMTLNIHGQRLNRDKLERQGSGYVARHRDDFAQSGDSWFRGICVRQGLDGSIYYTDWSDTGECHNYDDATTHRTNGRIYKVKYGEQPYKAIDISKLNDRELIAKLADNDGVVAEHVRRLLQERAVRGKLASDTAKVLADGYLSRHDQPAKTTGTTLQYLWAIHSTGGLPGLLETLSTKKPSPDDTVRGWLVRLQLENNPNPQTLKQLASLASTDDSSYVRLQLASGLQRLSLADRKSIAQGLVAHREDAADNNHALLLWYGIEPLVAAGDDDVLPLAVASKIPKLRQFIARHLATGKTPRFAPLLRWLEEQHEDVPAVRDILTGLHAGIEGRRDVAPDSGWKAASIRFTMSQDPLVRELSQRISLIQGSDDAFTEITKVVMNKTLDPALRERALTDLVTSRRPAVADFLFDCLNDPELRGTAIRGLAGFDRPEVGEQLLKRYPQLKDAEKLDAISTLTAREKTAVVLVNAVDVGKIDKQDLSEFDIRQLQRYKEPKLKELVNKVFGAIPTSAERATQIAEMKLRVLAAKPEQANASRGRAIFQKNCATCHTLFGEGRLVGPDLTGAQRTDLDYVLINVMDPSALVGHAYRVTIVELKDGRVINGIVKAEDTTTITLQTATDRVVVATQDVEVRQQQPVSMMPEGLLNRLSVDEIRDLVKYLGSPSQVPFP